MDITNLPPIPIPADSNDARDYHHVAIDVMDPRFKEPLIDINENGISVLPYYYLSDGSNPPYNRRISGSIPQVLCRLSLIPMLHLANKLLMEFDCEVVVYDAYRPIETQQGLWDYALAKIAQDNPNSCEQEIEALTSQYSSDPRRFKLGDATTWPTHSTGASVDVVLRSLTSGDNLDMGAEFDDLSDLAHTAFFELQLSQGDCSANDVTVVNRRLLYWAMTEAGFVNYPAEYWHFDFGNQMFVLNSEKLYDSAWYGYARLPNSKVDS